MKLVGIDIAKYEHAAYIMDSLTGESLGDPFFFKNNKEGFQKLYTELNKYAKNELLIGMEDTGHYNFAIESSLLAEGYKVALINPITTKNLRKASLKSVKSDKEDALLITKALLDKDYYRIVSIQDENLKEAKELTRYRTQLTIEMNRKKNVQKDKAKRAFRRIAVGVVSLALVGWLGYSVYNVYDSNKPQQTAEIDYSAITNYQQSLVTTDGE